MKNIAPRKVRREQQREAQKIIDKQIKSGMQVIPTLKESSAINVYKCPVHDTVTVNRFEGATPMLIKCPTCQKPATTNWYRVDQNLKPEYEWTQPSLEELKQMYQPAQKHVISGGLILKKIE